ncbi:uncharacterized protein LOC133530642 [Cydia pomonella]|uniref:uncharacterized protein LOC133530642 n=1 Tax=Cydia pomonella TaxID=82600 RepID=UPI002ADD9AE1|nr:uncharacterized protein LOC133530642 [Cydia pomonella]
MNALTEKNVEKWNAENSSDTPPRRRRRSSFFERRSIVPEPSMHIDADDTEDGEVDNEYLNQYYAQLQSEKNQWKKEVQNRRGILHDAELQLKLAKKSDKLRINYSILSNEDIEFLQAKPNLTDLVDSVRNLQKSTRETYALYKRAMELDEVVLRDVEGKVERVTRYLLERSHNEVE